MKGSGRGSDRCVTGNPFSGLNDMHRTGWAQNLRSHRHLHPQDQHMALNKHLVWAVALLIACLLAGCDNFRNWHGDETANPEYVLKVEIPSGAIDVDKRFDPAIAYDITFLMPDDQWRKYATTYYPADKLIAKPIASDAGKALPSACSQRDAVKTTEWSASDRIPFMRSADVTAHRFFWAVPGCRPDQAYVHWRLIPPNMTPTSPTR